MKDIKDILFVVQARLNSERVPRKMLRPFASSSLTEICLDKLLVSKMIPRENILFSVYEPELVELGEKKGIEVYHRSLQSITDAGITVQIIYEWYNKYPQTYFVLISACHPLLRVETIDDFISSFMRTENEGMFGVVERKTYYWDMYGEMINDWPPGKLLDTKLVDPIYEAGHCLYAGRMDRIGRGIHMGTFANKNDPELYIMKDQLEAFDIDYLWQFEAAERLYEKRNDLYRCG